MPEVWWQVADPRERASALRATIDSIERYQYQRIARARRNVAMYEGRNLAVLHPASYLGDITDADYRSPQFEAIRANVARSVVATAVAKIAGKQKPKVQFCVDRSDWQTKRKAKKRERFVEAIMLSRQGRYDDAWAVGIAAFRDCCVADAGVIQVTPDYDEKRIRIERRYPWEVFFDPGELKHGNPQNIFAVYGYDRDNLAARYPKFEQEIMSAPSLVADSRGQEDNALYGPEAGRQIKVREAIRLPLSKDKPGRWAVTAGGVDLISAEWTRKDFPFLWMFWEPWMIEGYGTSLVDNVFHMTCELAAQDQRMSDGQRLASNLAIVASSDAVNEADLDSNEIGVKIMLNAGHNASEVQFVKPSPISASDVQWRSLCEESAYKCSGVSQASANATREPGLPSAAAQRTVAEKGTERFAVPWGMYERVMSVGLARQILACADDIASDSDEGDDWAVTWVNDGDAKPIKWADVRDPGMPDEAIQVYAVSGLVNSPADRLELASELYDRKLITNESFLEVIQAKSINAELDNGNEITRWLERQMDSWLDYEPGDENDPESRFRYRPPPKFIGMDALAQCVVTVARAYMREDTDDCPPEKLQWFTRFMTDTDAMVQRLQAAQAELQAAARGKAAGGEIQGGAPGAAPVPGGAGAPIGPPPPAGPMVPPPSMPSPGGPPS